MSKSTNTAIGNAKKEAKKWAGRNVWDIIPVIL